MAAVSEADRQFIEAGIKAGIAEGMKNAGSTPNLVRKYVKVWGEIGNVKKNANNPHHKNDYATLEATLAVIKPVLVANEMALLQAPGEVDERGNQRVISILMDGESGERWTFTSSIPLGDKKTAQASGSCLTYARRYFLQAFFGMAPVDDDGQDASEDAPEEDTAYTNNGPSAVKKSIEAFEAEEDETGKAAAKRFQGEWKDKASKTGDKKVVDAYLKKYAELKAGPSNN